MDEREVAVLCTKITSAIRECVPQQLDPLIAELSETPWYPELVEVLKTIRYVLYAQRHSGRNKKSKH